MKHNFNNVDNNYTEKGIAAAMEAKRLSQKYKKDFLNCDDLMKIMSLGENNIRELMNSNNFPTINVGNRKVVSIISFVLWSINSNHGFY